MTNEVRDDTLTGYQRLREALLARRPSIDTAGYVGMAGALAALVFGGFLLAQQTGAYIDAGTPGGLAFVGALAAQLLVLGLAYVASVLLLYGDRAASWLVAGISGGLACGAALLPPLVGGRGWLSTLLLVLIALVLDAALAVAVFFVAFFAGLGHRPATGAETAP